MKFRKPAKRKNALNKWVGIPIFDDRDEFRKYFTDKGQAVPILRYWKDAMLKEGDWCLADDGGVTKIINIYFIPGGRVIKTPIGPFIVPIRPKYIKGMDNPERLKMPPFFMDTNLDLHYSKDTFDGGPRVTFNAKRKAEIRGKKKISYIEMQYVYLLARGWTEYDAVRRLFPYLSNLQGKVYALRSKVEIMEELKEELRYIAKKKGIDDDYIFDNMKDLIESSKDDKTKFNAIVKLAEEIGTFSKAGKGKLIDNSQQPKRFEGFSGNKLADASKEVTKIEAPKE